MIDRSRTLKHAIKLIRWRVRRFKTSIHRGPGRLRRAPIVFGNAMPKSGSHLMTQVLHGLPAIGPFVNPGFPPVNRDEANQPLSEDIIFRKIYNMLPGDIGYGYIHAKEPFLSILTQPEQATIFVYRDPRDMLVSHVFYANDININHGMRPYYEKMSCIEDQLNAAIEGVSDPEFFLSNVKDRYASYLGWLDQPDVLSIRFEELILEQDIALARLLGFLEIRGLDLSISRDQAIELIKKGIAPQKSGTFRKGEPGNWREHFTPENKERFKDVAGDLLVRLGYEENDDW